MIGNEKKPDLFGQIANIAGVASLLLSVAGTNLEKFNELQRWGLACASVVAVWFFMIGALFKTASAQQSEHARWTFMASAVLFLGGLVAGCVLLALVPFLSFFLGSDAHSTISWVAFGTFVTVTTLSAVVRLVFS